MSLDATRLANALKAAIPSSVAAAMDTEYPIDSELDQAVKDLMAAERLKFGNILSNGLASVLATAIVDELVTNGVVSVTGVTTGSDPSGPGSIT